MGIQIKLMEKVKSKLRKMHNKIHGKDKKYVYSFIVHCICYSCVLFLAVLHRRWRYVIRMMVVYTLYYSDYSSYACLVVKRILLF